MKIRKISLIVLVFLLIVAGSLLIYKESSPEQEFKIVSTIKNSFDNCTMVDISVVVNIKDYETEEMFGKIQAYYNELNGEPEELHIKLYNSAKDFENAKLCADKVYEKE